MKIVFTNVLPIVCVIGAVVVSCLGRDGWGWLLLIAVLTASTYSDK